MLSAIKNKDLQILYNFSVNSTKNAYDRTVLHQLAINHKVDLLFCCICAGCDQNIRDSDNKLFYEYLEKWEYDKLNN